MVYANSRCRYKNGGDRSPPPDTSYIDQLMIHKLCCPVPDVVHSLYPKHLILDFELFDAALTLGHLLYQQEHLLRRLFVDVGKVCIQPIAGHQFHVQRFALLLDVLQVPLPPNADSSFLLSWYCQAGNVIVAPQFVPQSVVYVINSLFHCEILLYKSSVDVFAHMSQAPDCHTLLYLVMSFSCPCFCPYERRGRYRNGVTINKGIR